MVLISNAKQAVESAPQEQRRSIRHIVVTQVAKIRLGVGREELCLLRDISAEGLQAEIYFPLSVGARVDIELRTAHNVGGYVVWVKNGAIGVQFIAPIPAATMLAHCSINEDPGALRPPRIKVNMRGLLRIGAKSSVVSISNISQAGLQIAAPERLSPGAACTIVLPRMAARAAKICWWRDGCAGLMLDEPIDYADFAAWRAGSSA